MKIVTAGRRFLDIDAYACAIAYAELLNLQGTPAVAYSSAALNESIPSGVRQWNAPLETERVVSEEDQFILVDVSDPEYLDSLVTLDAVEEVIDHHMGFESFWRDRLGNAAQLEFIGAACTQIYERWRDAGMLEHMSQRSARLLVAGILDNTLNFSAMVTHERDHEAYRALMPIAQLPNDWPAQYFRECQEGIFSDIIEGLENDTKTTRFESMSGAEVVFGQMVIWDGDRAVNEHDIEIRAVMGRSGAHWVVNIVSIREGKSYIIVSSEEMKRTLSSLLDVAFRGDIAEAPRLWLRKEILREDILRARQVN